MKTVMIFGTFDILHPGHLNLFSQARRLGDQLIVIIARDKNVTQIKGQKPVNNEKKRLREIKHFRNVDLAVLGSLEYPYKMIEQLRPDVICLGYDQQSFTDNLEKELVKRNLLTKIVRLRPYKSSQYKSCKLK
ncbi:MAG: adenylyltransferase/cytidyltransferase family protein [Candidatus Woesearchaeota archaeon]